MLEEIEFQAREAVKEFLSYTHLNTGDIFVVGCSSSEVCGEKIGSGSSPEAANAIFKGIYPVLTEKGIFLAAQCCEHLNRALIIEKEAAVSHGFDIVNVVPQPKAGGSFATTAYKSLKNAVAIEFISADAGMDIGGTLIGMHLKHVAVPVRLSIKKIGEANITCARTRPKCIGGERAIYNNDIM